VFYVYIHFVLLRHDEPVNKLTVTCFEDKFDWDWNMAYIPEYKPKDAERVLIFSLRDMEYLHNYA